MAEQKRVAFENRGSRRTSPRRAGGRFSPENRNGLIVNTEVFEANGTAERDAALVMLEQIPVSALGYEVRCVVVLCHPHSHLPRTLTPAPHRAASVRLIK
jgi:hypothetical protein